MAKAFFFSDLGDPAVENRAAEMAEVVRQLSAYLLRAPTATQALLAWCEARGIATGPITVLRQQPEECRYPDDDMLDELRPGRHERVAYRSVWLVRGPVVLSEADNWFVPDRLPPDIRDLLEATDIPFGAAVARLRPSRRTYFIRFAEWTAAGTASGLAGLLPSMTILEHKAVVLDQDRRPLSVVSERYRGALLVSVSQVAP